MMIIMCNYCNKLFHMVSDIRNIRIKNYNLFFKSPTKKLFFQI